MGMPLPEEQHRPAGEVPEAEMHLCSGSAGPSAWLHCAVGFTK